MKLDDKKIQALASVYHTDGYQVILDILEAICNEAENDFIGTHPTDPQAVLSSHTMLHAQRSMFIEYNRRADKIVKDYLGVAKDNNRLNPEAEIDNLLSAIPDVQ